MEEHRKYTRFRYQGAATLSWSNQSLPVDLVDLSLEGALIRLPISEPLAPSAGYTLNFELPETDNLITMLVSVAHQEDSLIGLRCQHLSVEDSDKLRHYIAFHADDEGVLQRELEMLLEQHKSV